MFTMQIEQHIKTAKLWETGDNSALGIFASMEIIIDGQHRDSMIGEIQKRMDQISEHRSMLEVVIAEEKTLENFLAFAKNSEIAVD